MLTLKKQGAQNRKYYLFNVNFFKLLRKLHKQSIILFFIFLELCFADNLISQTKFFENNPRDAKIKTETQKSTNTNLGDNINEEKESLIKYDKMGNIIEEIGYDPLDYPRYRPTTNLYKIEYDDKGTITKKTSYSEKYDKSLDKKIKEKTRDIYGSNGNIVETIHYDSNNRISKKNKFKYKISRQNKIIEIQKLNKSTLEELIIKNYDEYGNLISEITKSDNYFNIIKYSYDEYNNLIEEFNYYSDIKWHYFNEYYFESNIKISYGYNMLSSNSNFDTLDFIFVYFYNPKGLLEKYCAYSLEDGSLNIDANFKSEHNISDVVISELSSDKNSFAILQLNYVIDTSKFITKLFKIKSKAITEYTYEYYDE